MMVLLGETRASSSRPSSRSHLFPPHQVSVIGVVVLVVLTICRLLLLFEPFQVPVVVPFAGGALGSILVSLEDVAQVASAVRSSCGVEARVICRDQDEHNACLPTNNDKTSNFYPIPPLLEPVSKRATKSSYRTPYMSLYPQRCRVDSARYNFPAFIRHYVDKNYEIELEEDRFLIAVLGYLATEWLALSDDHRQLARFFVREAADLFSSVGVVTEKIQPEVIMRFHVCYPVCHPNDEISNEKFFQLTNERSREDVLRAMKILNVPDLQFQIALNREIRVLEEESSSSQDDNDAKSAALGEESALLSEIMGAGHDGLWDCLLERYDEGTLVTKACSDSIVEASGRIRESSNSFVETVYFAYIMLLCTAVLLLYVLSLCSYAENDIDDKGEDEETNMGGLEDIVDYWQGVVHVTIFIHVAVTLLLCLSGLIRLRSYLDNDFVLVFMGVISSFVPTAVLGVEDSNGGNSEEVDELSQPLLGKNFEHEASCY